MQTQIQLTGGDETAEFAALWQWLTSERALAGTVKVVRRPAAEDELGGALDTLVLALSSAGAVAALSRALTTWLATRRADVTITVKASGEVKLDARRVKDQDIAPLLRQVLRAPDES
ncbi:effector-associated constant component EACC1 [Nonomuraea guangzhouensis]|uniref:Uncharacterized protein n=1 Tax=Nonomuraea guangzhouensis TaxID=1291555 RepID=A0ABW4GA41_9ACTN|nr:hypothetical protein [Nonomuraea guangzhouensis]